VRADEKLSAFVELEAAIFNAVNKRKNDLDSWEQSEAKFGVDSNATENVRYSSGVALGSPSGLRSVLRCRVDFFPSLGLSVASDGARSVSDCV
jgi:hypothetical protein